MTDRNCILQIFGGLMQNPTLLAESDKYQLTLADFTTRFDKVIFNAIKGLFSNGAQRINPIDVENYLSSNEAARVLFEREGGIVFLNDALALTEASNFYFYYSKLKKINLLNDLNSMGFNTKEFYDEALSSKDAAKINSAFEELTITEIFETLRKKLGKVEMSYLRKDSTEIESAATGIEEFLDKLENEPEVGEPLQGEIFNGVVSGARLGTLYIRSAPSSVGKTRSLVGDACYLAYPFRYNQGTKEWEANGNCQKVLYICTEQQFKEIRTMILAYLTGMNESKFKYGQFSPRERVIVQAAIQVMKRFDNLLIVQMPNPTVELVKAIVRENCLLHGIQYVMYDYIFIGPALLNEFKDFRVRNDECLLMFATALKDLAVELNVFMMTSTQTNAAADDNRHIRNEATLAGGRSTINKADVGVILSRPTDDELTIVKKLNESVGVVPNLISDLYKNRAGQFTQVRIWSYFDYGTLRKRDLYMTNGRLEQLEMVKDEIPIWNTVQTYTKEDMEFLSSLISH